VFVKGKITFIMENCKISRHWWLTSVILATQEAEIRRIEVQSQPRQIVCETLSQKKKKKKRRKRICFLKVPNVAKGGEREGTEESGAAEARP
jgi:hypothetical protein